MLTLTVYSTETGKVVDRIDGETNADCELVADEKWGSDDFAWTYCHVEGDTVEIDTGVRKTAKQMADEIRASKSAYVTYGEADLGTPIKREDAIADIEAMDDEMIGEGTWAECDEHWNIKE